VKHFEQLKPLAAVDPLFLQAVVYVCPNKELPALVKQIPPFVSATWLSSTISDSKYQFLTTDEVRFCKFGNLISLSCQHCMVKNFFLC